MINDRFEYAKIERATINGSRHYCLPDGNPVPSVTTILDRTKPAEAKAALQRWKDSIGHERAQAITTEAANRGTRMHTYLEHYIKTGQRKPKASNPFSWPSHDMADVVIEHGLSQVSEFWGVEVPLYFPQIYAGTSDCIGLHQGIPAIMDFKQANKPKREEWIDDYKLQLAAYAAAHNEVYGTNIQRGVILMCVRPEEIEPGVYRQGPRYQQWIVEGDDFAHWTNQWWHRVEHYYMLNT